MAHPNANIPGITTAQLQIILDIVAKMQGETTSLSQSVVDAVSVSKVSSLNEYIKALLNELIQTAYF